MHQANRMQLDYDNFVVKMNIKANIKAVYNNFDVGILMWNKTLLVESRFSGKISRLPGNQCPHTTELLFITEDE